MNKKHTNKMMRSVLSVIAAMALLVGMVPTAFADGANGGAQSSGKEEPA